MIKSNLTPPTVDQATIDHYVAKGNSLRSRAVIEFFRSLFPAKSTPEAPMQNKIRSKLHSA